ncbi:hypothetical protein PR202_gb04227 [Eleusine coracana subsp. coracana]|uniref:Transcription initiation factor TFIID subunit 12 domain-containing protein n=1 Tax=Eleusine coracana subsp. coracana TaxID=191504 RepID=A0AAV5E3D1_ELECO|nr:hypothetical protein PR202_gb04227 [Eleusine coracana subsp. coracana]
MADPPPAGVSASPQPDQLAASISTPQNPNPNPLLSPQQIPPSPTVSDLSAHISSPQQLDPAAAAAAGSMDFPPRPPQLQAASPTQAPAGFGQIQRSGSASRLSAASQMPQYAAMAARMYGGQMSFSGGQQQQQQQQLAARAAMLGQGQLGILQGQGNAASAAHYGLQSQMMAQVASEVFGVSRGGKQEAKDTWWWNDKVQRAIKEKKECFKRLHLDKSATNIEGYKIAKRAAKRAVSVAKGQAYDNLYQRLGTKEGEKDIYRMARIRERKTRDINQIKCIKDGVDRLLVRDEEIKDRWREYFDKLFNGEEEGPILELDDSFDDNNRRFVRRIQETEIEEALKRMKSGKAMGPDGIPIEVDPQGKVDADVEDLLLELADDFIDSVTAFACTLAKHRKSSVVEAKDVLLHLERNWHLTVPGFSREDKNSQRNSVKPLVDPQQPENDVAGIRGTSNKLIANNSAGNHQIRPQVAEPSPMPVVGPQSKVPRF